MPVHGATSQAKIGLYTHQEHDNFVAHLELSKTVVTKLLERGRVTVVAADLELDATAGEHCGDIRYLTIDLRSDA